MWHDKDKHGHESHQGRHEEGRPSRLGGRRHGFVQAWLLLQLAKQPAHGYELIEGLAQQEDAVALDAGSLSRLLLLPHPDQDVVGQVALDAGSLYRLLRRFEEGGLVSSRWESGESGPARRVYEITDEGLEYLHTWAATVRRDRARLDRFLADYTSFVNTHTGGGEKHE
jgi:PadR family transcriptional regulator PadR